MQKDPKHAERLGFALDATKPGLKASTYLALTTIAPLAHGQSTEQVWLCACMQKRRSSHQEVYERNSRNAAEFNAKESESQRKSKRGPTGNVQTLELLPNASECVPMRPNGSVWDETYPKFLQNSAELRIALRTLRAKIYTISRSFRENNSRKLFSGAVRVGQ